jgi:hypothetical protein
VEGKEESERGPEIEKLEICTERKKSKVIPKFVIKHSAMKTHERVDV